MTFDSAVRYVHYLLAAHLKPSDVAVDATIGNGWDTTFMAELVGASGVVYGFDVQPVAIEVTRSRITGLQSDVRLHLQGHETMASIVEPHHHKAVRAITFNLGYLPGGDKNVTTTVETTVKGLEQARDILAPDGLITVVCYRHSEGEHELLAVRELLTSWSQDAFTVVESQFINHVAKPPLVFVVAGRPSPSASLTLSG